jgi:hypothetical protein
MSSATSELLRPILNAIAAPPTSAATCLARRVILNGLIVRGSRARKELSWRKKFGGAADTGTCGRLPMRLTALILID